jgi:hypothetical protein
MHLGALTKSMHNLKLVGYPPETPLGHNSVVSVVETIKKKIPDLAHCSDHPAAFCV